MTEAIPEIEAMGHELPTIGESEAGYYSRQEGKGILLGAYESTCHHWAFDGTPLDFGHELLPNDLARMDRNFEVAMDRMPCLGKAGIKRVINGPMIFSPDLGPLLGPHPELTNYFCACGVMSGFNQGAGIGKVISEWIVDGEPEMDVNFWDVARFGRWAGKRFTFERTKYYYENRQERPYPHLECAAGRPMRTFPAYAGAEGQRRCLRLQQWLGAAAVVCAARRRTARYLRLCTPELVEDGRRGMPGGAQRRRPVRDLDLRQIRGSRVRPPPAGCGGCWRGGYPSDPALSRCRRCCRKKAG